MLTIRNLALHEMVFPMEVAYKEGWNPGLYDGAAFFQADPDGFFLAELDGGMVGGISAVRYDDRTVFIGSHFVLPPFRGKGIGKALWEHVLDLAGDKSVGINGLPEGRSFYASYGFDSICNIIRYGGCIFAEARRSDDVCEARSVGLRQLVLYDAGIFGLSRERLIKNWLETPGMESLCLPEEGEIRGWGCMRRCRQGWRLGPVFAETRDRAEKIIRHLALKTRDENVYMDITESNVQAIRLAFAMGMTPWGARLKMNRGPRRNEPLDKIYAFTTLDIG